jgi:hypothetical protein
MFGVLQNTKHKTFSTACTRAATRLRILRVSGFCHSPQPQPTVEKMGTEQWRRRAGFVLNIEQRSTVKNSIS